MNISPHHQRTAKYPWPGMASRVVVVVAVAVILLVGFVLIADPFTTTNDDESDPSAMRGTAARMHADSSVLSRA